MRRFRPIIVAGTIVVLGVLNIRAEEATKPLLEQPPQDSIATAKQSFESLSKKHQIEDRGALQIPTLAAPELNLGAPTAAESSKGKAAAKPSKNWLVDGVLSKQAAKDRVSSSADTRRPGETDSREADAAEDPKIFSLVAGAEVSSAHERAAPHIRESKAPPADSVNPLASYMSGWISTQDRALLLPQKDQDASAATWGNNLSNLTAASSGAVASGSAVENFGLSQPALRIAARENPYLGIDSFNANKPPESGPAANLKDFAPLASKMIDPVGRAPIFQPSPPAVSGTTPARDLAKPDDNAKYFKQLKRF